MAFRILPTSGKSGYLKLKTLEVLEIPIYNWSLNSSKYRSEYRTSYTANFPSRIGGDTAGELTFTTPYFKEFITTIFGDGAPQLIGDIGWFDELNIQRTLIEFNGYPSKQIFEFNYTFNKPAFTSIVTIPASIAVNSIIDRQPISDITSDQTYVQCGKRCDNPIYSSHITEELEFDGIEYSKYGADVGSKIKHVSKAIVIRDHISPLRITSENPDQQLPIVQGVFDEHLELTVEGDFDYWFKKLYKKIDDIADSYRIYWGTGPDDNMDIFAQKVVEITNFTVDIFTGRVISAVVKLGAAYGT